MQEKPHRCESNPSWLMTLHQTGYSQLSCWAVDIVWSPSHIRYPVIPKNGGLGSMIGFERATPYLSVSPVMKQPWVRGVSGSGFWKPCTVGMEREGGLLPFWAMSWPFPAVLALQPRLLKLG